MRKKSDSVTLRNEYLLEKIKNIKAEHPFWGYRRVWAYLRYIDGLIINKKRVYRLMRENNLTVKPNTRLIAKRASERPKPRADRPKQWELFWLREWENERELSLELDKWVEYYNRSYLHSALGYRAPIQAEEVYYKNHSSHKNAA